MMGTAKLSLGGRDRNPAVVLLLIGAAALVAVASYTSAGDLDPPAGPIAPSHKTLTEVEPRIAISATNTPGDANSLFKISQPGSYYLTGNITGVANKHGIEIVASGVTLDLNGFELRPPGAGTHDGVTTTVAGLTNIAVVNGSIRDWGDDGIDLATFGATTCRVEGVTASGNNDKGISVGKGSTIAHCRANLNGTPGISGFGIHCGEGTTISNCSSSSNGFSGIFTGSGCTISNCSSSSNGASGIAAGFGCTISNCTAEANGFSIFGGNGIDGGHGSTISNCTMVDNQSYGVYATEGSVVTDCSIRANGADGIYCTTGCAIYGNTCMSNANDGILCITGCVIRGNTCSRNGNNGDGAGIHATGADNRIEGNNCIDADRGIDVDAAGNIIIGNTCSGNTSNWAIAADNLYGRIVSLAGASTPAVSGNVNAASVLVSADPWANFAY